MFVFIDRYIAELPFIKEKISMLMEVTKAKTVASTSNARKDYRIMQQIVMIIIQTQLSSFIVLKITLKTKVNNK